jgi:hypothetical protein
MHVADSLDTAKEGDMPVVMVVPVAPLRGGGGQEGGGRGLPRRNGGRGLPRRNRWRGARVEQGESRAKIHCHCHCQRITMNYVHCN